MKRKEDAEGGFEVVWNGYKLAEFPERKDAEDFKSNFIDELKVKIRKKKGGKMERILYPLPKHPVTKRGQAIIIERISKESVWHLVVVDKDKLIPLINLKKPRSAEQILEVLKEQEGEEVAAQFIKDGYSK